MPDTALDLAALTRMTQAELDDAFRRAHAGDIPNGEAEGTVLVAVGTELSETAAKLVHLLAWKGKIFDAARGEVINEVLVTGVHAVRATIAREPSWFDGGECIALDYSHSSLIAHWVRDELRQVGPGLYLGIAFWERTKLVDFALRFPTGAGG